MNEEFLIKIFFQLSQQLPYIKMPGTTIDVPGYIMDV